MKKIVMKLLIFTLIYSLIIVLFTTYLPDLTNIGRIVSGMIGIISIFLAESVMGKNAKKNK
ncbi:MAG: hypothetical protein WBA84_07955 [Carnobacterium sp.]|uniref:hypothetical protein n=1 Tax=Carnobacterium sp. TaxID=48221 RepID=UPI003C72292B